MFSPFHILLINIIRGCVVFFIFFDTENLAASIYITLNICICIFIILVFTEIIELNIFGLSKMTKKNIELRAQFDGIDIYDYTKNEKIDCKGYVFDFKDDEPKELKELRRSDTDSSFGH